MSPGGCRTCRRIPRSSTHPGTLPPDQALDPTRPVVGNDGWESAETDIIGVHDYDEDPARIHQRYWGHEDIPTILRRVRPGDASLP